MIEDQIQKLLDKHNDDYLAAATEIFSSRNRELCTELISIGIQKIAKNIRQKQRREIKHHNIVQDFIKFETSRPLKKGPPIPLSEARIKEGMKLASIFVKWKIGSTLIGDMNKDGLLAAASHERKSAAGHLDNAIIYEEIARPMNNTETVGEHYRSKINQIETLFVKSNKGKITKRGGKERGTEATI